MAVNVPNRDDWFAEEDRFPRPQWGAIHGWMRAFVTESDLEDAWHQWTHHWLDRLCKGVGGGYATDESENFHLVSDLTPANRAKLLSFVEAARRRIYKVLGDVAPAEAHGKHVLLRFTEEDDYYAYISHFDPDGAFAGSSGTFVRDGYEHIAYPQNWSAGGERRTIVHELTHNLLAHLPLPPWLNEGLAMAFESDVAEGANQPLSREEVAKHRDYWNAATIQSFWQGTSFSHVEGHELSYSLSRILLNLISIDIRPGEIEFRRFVLRADWGDAGEIAAREHLGTELKNLVATFLGAGDWAPRPKTWLPISHPNTSEPSLENGANPSTSFLESTD